MSFWSPCSPVFIYLIMLYRKNNVTHTKSPQKRCKIDGFPSFLIGRLWTPISFLEKCEKVSFHLNIHGGVFFLNCENLNQRELPGCDDGAERCMRMHGEWCSSSRPVPGRGAVEALPPGIPARLDAAHGRRVFGLAHLHPHNTHTCCRSP